MALIEITEVDQIEIVTKFKHIQVRTATRIIDDATNEVKAESFSRTVVTCGDDAKAMECEVDNISTVVWTAEVRTLWTEHVVEQDEL